MHKLHNFQIKNCKTDSIETKMTQICIKSAFIKCTGRTLAFHFATGVQMPRTGGNPPPKDVRAWRLRLSGHLARAKPSTDYAHALHSIMYGPLKDWKRPAARPTTTWLWTVKSDLQPPVNIGLFTGSQWAQDCCMLYVEAICEDSHAPGRGKTRWPHHK